MRTVTLTDREVSNLVLLLMSDLDGDAGWACDAAKALSESVLEKLRVADRDDE
jgi:hypothetical protein